MQNAYKLPDALKLFIGPFFAQPTTKTNTCWFNTEYVEEIGDCDFWLDVTALGACCEDRANLDPGVVFPQPVQLDQAPFLGDSPPAHDGARHCAIILESSSGTHGQGFDLSKTDSEFLDLEASLAEVRRLRDENARLRNLLIERSIRIPEVQPTSGIPQTPQTIGA